MNDSHPVNDRITAELSKTSGINGTDPWCREGIVSCNENQARHSKIRPAIPCIAYWPEQSEIQRKGWNYTMFMLNVIAFYWF